MSVGIGSKSKLGFAVETAYGTFPAATSGTLLGFLSESIQNTRNTFKSEEINSNRQLSAIRSGNVAAGGDINMELSPNALGTFYKHFLMVAPTTTTVTPVALAATTAYTRGQIVSSNSRVYLCTRAGTSSSAAVTTGLTSVDSGEEQLEGTAYFQYYGTTGTVMYKHVFQGGTTKTVGGIAIEREVFLDSGSQFFRYVGGRINTMAVTVPQEGIVTSNFGFLFLDLASTASSTIFSGTTAPVDEPFAGSEAVIRTKLFGGSYTDDFSISTMTINGTNNFETNVYTIGNKRRRDLPEGRREITGSFTAYFEDMTKFNYFANESVVGLEATFNHKGMFLLIDLPEAKLTGGSPAPVISGNGVVSHSFEFQAFKSAGAGDIKIELYNSTSSY